MEEATKVSVQVIRTSFYDFFTEAEAEDLWPMFLNKLTENVQAAVPVVQTLPSNNAPVPVPTPTPVGIAPTQEEDNLYFPRIVEMLWKKNIKLHLDGCKTHLSQAGIMSLVSPIFGSGYYGTFSRDGYFNPRKDCKPEFIAQLRDIEDNGVEAAKRIGMLTGNCCVCGRTLTNEGSVEAGIGPICAGKAF